MSLIPLLLSAVVALGRYNYQDSSADTTALDPRSIVQAILVPKNYSTFGLRHRQKLARWTVVPMLCLRMVCGAVLLTVMQGLDCTVGTYGCWCLYSNRLGDNRIFSGETYRYQAWTSDGVNVFCEGIVMAHRVEVGNGTWGFTREQFVDDHYARGLCDSENLSPEDLVDIDSYISSNWIYAARNCSLYSDLPGMLREPCQLGAVDIVRFRQCRDGLAGLSSFFSGTCDGRFTVCAAFTDSMTPEKLRVVIYISLPMCALCVLLVAHILAQMLNCSLMDVEENRTLRKQVNQKTRVYLEQLQNGHLEYSVLRLGIRCNHLFPERIVSYGLSKGTWWLMTPYDDLALMGGSTGLNFVGGVGLVAW